MYPTPAGMITKNFSWAESVISTHRTITNEIPDNQIALNIAHTSEQMEMVRTTLNKPIIVNSWYRCPELNEAVGGAKNSDHMQGNAVDFISPQYGAPLDICKAIVRLARFLGFKQLILEHTWVHISFSPIPNIQPKLEVLSLLSNGSYAVGLTDKNGVPY